MDTQLRSTLRLFQQGLVPVEQVLRMSIQTGTQWDLLEYAMQEAQKTPLPQTTAFALCALQSMGDAVGAVGGEARSLYRDTTKNGDLVMARIDGTTTTFIAITCCTVGNGFNRVVIDKLGQPWFVHYRLPLIIPDHVGEPMQLPVPKAWRMLALKIKRQLGTKKFRTGTKLDIPS